MRNSLVVPRSVVPRSVARPLLSWRPPRSPATRAPGPVRRRQVLASRVQQQPVQARLVPTTVVPERPRRARSAASPPTARGRPPPWACRRLAGPGRMPGAVAADPPGQGPVVLAGAGAAGQPDPVDPVGQAPAG